MVQRDGDGADPTTVIDDLWLDVDVEYPPPPPPPPRRHRPEAPWLALLLGLFTAGAIVMAGWAALSLLGDGARALIADPTSIPAVTTSAPSPSPTTTTASGTSAPTAPPETRAPTIDTSSWENALVQATSAAAEVNDEVAAASQAWDSGAADFASTRARFVAAAENAAEARSMLSASLVPPGTDQALLAALLASFGDLTGAAEDTVRGLDAPDDGTLRRDAVERTAAVTAEIERLVGDLRSALS
jgi:hypothetical protein